MDEIKANNTVAYDDKLFTKLVKNWQLMLKPLKAKGLKTAINNSVGRTQLGCYEKMFEMHNGQITFDVDGQYNDGFDVMRKQIREEIKSEEQQKIFKELVNKVCSGIICAEPNYFNRNLWCEFTKKRPVMSESVFTKAATRAGVTGITMANYIK